MYIEEHGGKDDELCHRAHKEGDCCGSNEPLYILTPNVCLTHTKDKQVS